MVSRRELLYDELLYDESFRNFVPPSRIYNTFKIWSKISNRGFMAQLQGVPSSP